MTEVIKFTPDPALANAFPEFAKITIYGSVRNPLFPVSQVGEFLGVGRLRLDKGGYEEGEDYVQVESVTPAGVKRVQNLLTEQGLYTVMCKTDSPVGRRFRRFVLVIMQELRMHGVVTTEAALEKLHQREAELANQRDENARLHQQLDEEHGLHLQYKRDSEKFYLQKMAAQTKLLAVQNQLASHVDNYSAEGQLELIKEKTMKRIYVYMVRPHRAIADEFPDYDMDDPTPDDEICFEVSYMVRSQPACAEFFVYRDVSMARVHAKLHERDFTVLVGDRPHRNMFRGTLDRLRYTIDELL